MKLAHYLEAKNVIPKLSSNNKDDVIKELADKLSEISPQINQERLVEVFLEREKLCSTAVDYGIAVPHAKMDGLSDIVLGFGRSLEGIDYESLDGKPTHFFVILIIPQESTGEHLRLLARISKIFKDQELRSKLMSCETDEEIVESIIQEDEKY